MKKGRTAAAHAPSWCERAGSSLKWSCASVLLITTSAGDSFTCSCSAENLVCALTNTRSAGEVAAGRVVYASPAAQPHLDGLHGQHERARTNVQVLRHRARRLQRHVRHDDVAPLGEQVESPDALLQRIEQRVPGSADGVVRAPCHAAAAQ